VTDSAISADALVKTYPKGVRALDGLDIDVAPGTVFALLGPNGAGKSTAVRVLTTLSLPDSGGARVAGHDVLREPGRVRRAIGVVAQRTGVDPDATGRENLDLQARIHDMEGRARRARVAELLRRLGLEEAADRAARTYSGGMARRLDIALALVHRPAVLFLDEPTTGLDPEVRADIWEEVRRLSGDEGLAILLTTHYLEEADRLAARLAIVDRGRVVVEGAPERLKAELHGDAVQVELGRGQADGRAAGALGAVAGVREVALDGTVLRARVDRGATALPTVLAALESAGVHVASVTVSHPSLDDVYLRHAGRTFAHAGGDRPEVRA
jgi:ABC-2 type transport system ATP-binding protein